MKYSLMAFLFNLRVGVYRPYFRGQFKLVDLEFQPDTEITVSRDRVRDFKDWLSG